MATPAPDRPRIVRWGRTARAVHWVHATAFCILLGSGLCLYLPALAQLVGRRPVLKEIHLYTALGWGTALIVLFCVGDRRELRDAAHEVDYLSTETRMNRGQKLNTIATAAFALLFAVSGVSLWLGERDTRYRLPNALLVHDWLMYVSFVLFVGHLVYALILPSTRHALNGMTRGWVDEQWARRHHPAWVAAQKPETESRRPLRGDGRDGVLDHDVPDRLVVPAAGIPDQVTLEPVRATLRVGGDHDLVGIEGAERVIDRLERVAVAHMADRLEALLTELCDRAREPELRVAPGTVFVRHPRLQAGVERRSHHDGLDRLRSLRNAHERVVEDVSFHRLVGNNQDLQQASIALHLCSFRCPITRHFAQS